MIDKLIENESVLTALSFELKYFKRFYNSIKIEKMSSIFNRKVMTYLLEFFTKNNYKEVNFLELQNWLKISSNELIEFREFGLLYKKHFKSILSQYLDTIILLDLQKIDFEKYNNQGDIKTLKVDILNILKSRKSDVELTNFDKSIDSFIKDFTNKDKKIFKTKYHDLDNMIDFKESTLNCILARPANGKTTFSLNLAKSFCEQGYKVLFLSFEMAENEIIEKLVKLSIELNNDNVDENNVFLVPKVKASKQLEDFKSTEYLKNLNLVCSFALDVQEIKLLADSLNVDIIFIDQLDCLPINLKIERNDLRLGKNITDLKDYTMESKKCIFLLHQLNRKADFGNDINFSLIKDSSMLEQKADKIFFIIPEKQENKTGFENNIETRLVISKNRMGSTGTIDFDFNLGRGIFTEKSSMIGLNDINF